MGVKNRIGRLRMVIPLRREILLQDVVIHLTAAKIDVPGVQGWVGTWSIYALPMSRGDAPVRYGDTDLQPNERMALGNAQSIAILVAGSL